MTTLDRTPLSPEGAAWPRPGSCRLRVSPAPRGPELPSLSLGTGWSLRPAGIWPCPCRLPTSRHRPFVIKGRAPGPGLPFLVCHPSEMLASVCRGLSPWHCHDSVSFPPPPPAVCSDRPCAQSPPVTTLSSLGAHPAAATVDCCPRFHTSGPFSPRSATPRRGRHHAGPRCRRWWERLTPPLGTRPHRPCTAHPVCPPPYFT